MKSDNVITNLAQFFNDFIGAVVPGLIFISLFLVLHPGLRGALKLGPPMDSALVLLAAIGVCFALGHGLLGLYYEFLENALKTIPWFKNPDGTNSTLVRDQPTLLKEAENSRSYGLTKQLLMQRFGSHVPRGRETKSELTVSEVRNLAMTLSNESATLGRRFMFITLLAQGTGAALLLVGLETLVVAIATKPFGLLNPLIQYQSWLGYILQTAILLFLALVFFRRADSFYSRAIRTPFSVAPIDLYAKPADHDQAKSS